VDFKVIGSSLDFLVGKTSVSLLDDLPLIDINFNISNPLFKLIKALFDYSLATFVLFFIFPFIYLTIKLTGKQSEFSNFVLKVPRIFSGKVSFVGPKHGTGKENLFLVKKGLTGFWYIEDGETRENEKTDLFYAKNQNIWLDIEILGRTLSKMWGSKK
jgi:lipopolysaccharide/colanic/teichoic acid biosynthesis glycosyltransferase